MVNLTENEKKVLLVIFKDLTVFYNANSISKVVGISHIGAQKILKKAVNSNLVAATRIGKAITYQLKLSDDYVSKLISFILADEANNHKRWVEEFKELFKEDTIVLIHGSAIKKYDTARDIDILVVVDKDRFNEINKIIKARQEVLPKELHAIKMTEDDLRANIKNKNKAIIDIIKNAIVLHGQEKYVRMIKDFGS